MTAYEKWYKKHAGLSDDFTWGEEVWKAARKALLRELRKLKKLKLIKRRT